MKIIRIFLFGLIGFFGAPSLQAAPVVLADTQVVKIDPKTFLLRLRSSGPQAFDMIKQTSTVTLQVRLYQSQIGKIATKTTGVPFGSFVLTQPTGNQVLLTITFNATTYKTQVRQGSHPNIVELLIRKP